MSQAAVWEMFNDTALEASRCLQMEDAFSVWTLIRKKLFPPKGFKILPSNQHAETRAARTDES